jgi:signal transduction histidine kinase
MDSINLESDLKEIITLIAHHVRTPLSVISNDMQLLNLKGFVNESDLTLRKVNEIAEFLSALTKYVESKEHTLDIKELARFISKYSILGSALDLTCDRT